MNLYFSNTIARRFSSFYPRYIEPGENCYLETKEYSIVRSIYIYIYIYLATRREEECGEYKILCESNQRLNTQIQSIRLYIYIGGPR